MPGGVPGLGGGGIPGFRGHLVQGGVPGPGGGCTWSRGGLYLPEGVPAQGGVPTQGVRGLGVCAWSVGTFSLGHLFPGVYLVLGGVPGPSGWVYLVPGGGCTWSQRGTWYGGVPGLGKGEGVPAQELPHPPWTERHM